MRPIDADALEEMFKAQYERETCDNYDGVRCRASHCDDALGIIDSAPTIDAAPVRRGEWTRFSSTMMECSCCGKHVPYHRYNFCPNCGADMRGVSHGTD